MRFVDRQNQIGELCAEPFLHLHERNTDARYASWELIAIKLRHRVVYIQHQLGAATTQWQRRKDGGIGHGANDRDVVRMFTRKLHCFACGGDEEAHVAFYVRGSAGASVARDFQADDIDAVDESGLSRRQRNRVHMVSALRQRLRVALHATIVNIRGIGND